MALLVAARRRSRRCARRERPRPRRRADAGAARRAPGWRRDPAVARARGGALGADAVDHDLPHHRHRRDAAAVGDPARALSAQLLVAFCRRGAACAVDHALFAPRGAGAPAALTMIARPQRLAGRRAGQRGAAVRGRGRAARAALRRPARAARLTLFYLVMSAGGALGGVFTALVAPVVFDWTWEHPLLVLAAALRCCPLARWSAAVGCGSRGSARGAVLAAAAADRAVPRGCLAARPFASTRRSRASLLAVRRCWSPWRSARCGAGAAAFVALLRADARGAAGYDAVAGHARRRAHAQLFRHLYRARHASGGAHADARHHAARAAVDATRRSSCEPTTYYGAQFGRRARAGASPPRCSAPTRGSGWSASASGRWPATASRDRSGASSRSTRRCSPIRATGRSPSSRAAPPTRRCRSAMRGSSSPRRRRRASMCWRSTPSVRMRSRCTC